MFKQGSNCSTNMPSNDDKTLNINYL